MKIIVVSDSHNNFQNLDRIVKQNSDSDLFIHLGDGFSEYLKIKSIYENLNFIMVKGNCDPSTSNLQKDHLLNVDDFKIFACHGNMYNVKDDLRLFYDAAVNKDANIALYGHTHISYIKKQGAVLIMNPGSISLPRDGNPSYGTIEIIDGVINPYIIRL